MVSRRWIFALILSASVGSASEPPPAPVAVRFREGVVRGFLSLETPDGRILADGDWIQFLRGDVVTNRLVFHFRDGSLQDETATFRQHGSFELLTDHLIQKGPSFPRPVDLTIDRPSGRVVVETEGKDGKPKKAETRMALPADLANGLVGILIKNLPRSAGSVPMTMLVADPKPSLVKVTVTREGEDAISLGALTRTATRYVVRVDLGPIKELLAKLLKKLPPPTRVWVLEGDAPTFLRSEGPAYLGGPPWRIELTSPKWPGER